MFKEREVFIGGLWELAGFRQESIQVNKVSKGKTTYTLRRKLSQAVSALTSFSHLPLYTIFNLGIILSFTSMAYIVYLATNWLSFAKPPTGYTSLIVSIWLLGGLTILFVGIIGIYLAKIFSEVKQRPLTLVREVHQKRIPKSPED